MDRLAYITLAGLFVIFVACVDGIKEEAKPDEEKFDGVGIGLVERPRSCKKTTKKGGVFSLDNISADKTAENLTCCRKFCPPKSFVRRKICPPKNFVH